MTAEELFQAALVKVESESIRTWAQTEHNRSLWLRLAESYLGRKDNVEWLATDIVSTAIGLW